MNPSPVPSGYAVPCPTFSLSAYSVPQSDTLTGTITPAAGITQYIYTTGYIYNGSTWLPETISGSSPYAGYSNVVSSLTLNSTVLSTLPIGTIYAVAWDWSWNAANNCYFGPGSSVCNQGSWRLQEFTLTALPTPTPTGAPTPSPTSSACSGNCYYISKTLGDDSRTAVQARNPSTPWQHLPGMAGCTGTGCATIGGWADGEKGPGNGYVPVPGDRFILRGGDRWINAPYFLGRSAGLGDHFKNGQRK